MPAESLAAYRAIEFGGMSFQQADIEINATPKDENSIMYLVIIGWFYVVIMMFAAEISAPDGTFLGAIVTLLFYGLLPIALVVYLMGTPLRKKARLAQEAAERQTAAASFQPDASGHPASGTANSRVASVREPD